MSVQNWNHGDSIPAEDKMMAFDGLLDKYMSRIVGKR